MSRQEKAAAAIRARAPREYRIECLESNTIQKFGHKTVKVVHFVRHGQGLHNKLHDEVGKSAYADPRVLDARLTDLGKKQAKTIQSRAKEIDPDLIIVSPLSRAIATAVIGFKPATCPFVCHELCREMIGKNICDKRRKISEVKKDFPEVDYCNIDSNDDSLFTPERETISACVARGYEFMNWLRQRKEKNIAVVCHSSFLLALFNGVLECKNADLATWFEVAECRSVRLVFSRAKPPVLKKLRMLKALECGLSVGSPLALEALPAKRGRQDDVGKPAGEEGQTTKESKPKTKKKKRR
jgi:broad specificity phosphatase PhoE